jgi:glycosyltransferase involved in cell wall biosynthesis
VPGHVAIVPPRFGPQVVGGSESVSREIAHGLARRGWDVDVLTTRAIDHYTWANDLPEGLFTEDGVKVYRYSTVVQASRRGRASQRQIEAGEMPPLDDQWTWLNWRFRAPDLFHHLLRDGDQYDAVVFSPYLFWTTIVCMEPVVSRAVVMPCLHDEPYARLAVVRPVLSDAASIWFLSEPEHHLAHRLGRVAERHQVTGSGVTVPDAYDPEAFRRRYRQDRPFLLYAGRREKDKGWDALLELFADALRWGGLEDLDLVTIGVGDVAAPPALAGRVRDLGFLPDDQRDSAFAAALAYVQPSRMESFSRTIMEAWLAGTPVLAIDGSNVVTWHCERSGGGATFGDGHQLHELVRRWLRHPDEADTMAAGGRRYVLDNYSWPVVLDRMERDLELLANRPGR